MSRKVGETWGTPVGGLDVHISDPSGRESWNPTPSQSARRDGAPVGGLGIRILRPNGLRVGESHVSQSRRDMGHPRRWFGRSHFRPQRSGVVESYPFAKCAKGWGTRRRFRDSHFTAQRVESWGIPCLAKSARHGAPPSVVWTFTFQTPAVGSRGIPPLR